MNQPIFHYQEPEQNEPQRSGPRVRHNPRLVERDYALLLDLLRLRFATTGQLCDLHFPGQEGHQVGRLKACQRRLKKLVDARLIRALKIPLLIGSHPHVYLLTPSGLDQLMKKIHIDPSDVSLPNVALGQYNLPEKGFASHEHLSHILNCTQVFLAFSRACQQTGVEVIEWLHEYELRTLNFVGKVQIPHPITGREMPYTLVPDHFFHLMRGGDQELRAFVEVDRSTITVNPTRWELRSMTKKYRGYVALFNSADFLTRFGDHCLVLTVTKTPERLASLYDTARSTLGDDERFLFTTYDRATDPHQVLTAPIWQIADEELSQGTNGECRRHALLPG